MSKFFCFFFAGGIVTSANRIMVCLLIYAPVFFSTTCMFKTHVCKNGPTGKASGKPSTVARQLYWKY